MSSIQSSAIKEEILELKRSKDAIILGHYYLRDELQEVSDYVGDSLALAQEAQRCEKSIIVFCGVHFMAETAKILNPTRKVILPDMSATCSLALSCPAEDFAAFKAQHPGYTVISYINCSAEIKALSDIICTSGNAEKIVCSLPKDEKIIFAPDRNLGGYINRVTGRQMLLWDGSCTVHEAMQVEKIGEMRSMYPQAKVIAHPECRNELLAAADFVGSTKAMLDYIGRSGSKSFIVATESGILWQMKRDFPDCNFIMLPVENSSKRMSCATCGYMKQNTLEKLRDCLRDEQPEVKMDSLLMDAARKPILRMMEISRQQGIIK